MMKKTWMAEIFNGTYVEVTSPREPDWVAENWDNPLWEWDGRWNISASRYRKAVAQYRATRRAVLSALTASNDDRAQADQLTGIGRNYGAAFNKLDGTHSPFLETEDGWQRRPRGDGRSGTASGDTVVMDICVASMADLNHLARLLWLLAAPDEQARRSVTSFESDLAAWWTDHAESHVAFIARLSESEVVGIAWLALVSRVPRPGANNRRSADIQSVFVLPEHRGRRIGQALVQTAAEYASQLGVGRVTVHSGRKAVPVYERLGFASSRQLLQKETP